MENTFMPPEEIRLFHLTGISLALGVFFTLVTVAVIWPAVYNLFFHTLKQVPGPFWTRAFTLPSALLKRNGKIIPWLHATHEKYGPVVRVAPNEISFTSGETAWQDIYGFRVGKNKTGTYLKDLRLNGPPVVEGHVDLLWTDDQTHSRVRKNLSHAFSDRALREEEPLIQTQIDFLIERLHEQAQEGNAIINMEKWYNYTTFDVIADLVFGEPLYCLRDRVEHPWVQMALAGVKATGLFAVHRNNPLLRYLDTVKELFSPSDAPESARREFIGTVSSKVSQRIAQGTARPDFMSHILKNQESGDKGLSKVEMDLNVTLLMLAGSETTATLLTGFTYYLATHPSVYSKLMQEIRSAFTTQKDITMTSVEKLEYLNACIREALRVYPPVPTGFARVAPPGGGMVSGYFVPEGTSVYMSQHAANHSTRNFKDADVFVPERWLGDKRYESDNRAVIQSFSFGPRNCLGKNLAYAELRLIIAKVYFNFDMELQPESSNWLEGNRLFVLWEKPSLMMKLKPIVRAGR